MLTASWIWSSADRRTYNQYLLARRVFELPSWEFGSDSTACLKITADSWYRLFINGQWVTDGPARSWPEHYQYDVIDAAPYLKAGQNELRVLIRYYGVGNFHTLPQQAGLLAQLDVEQPQEAPYQLSPHLPAGMAWARGTVATRGGSLSVEWQRQEGSLQVRIMVPPGTVVEFVSNPTHAGLQVDVSVVES